MKPSTRQDGSQKTLKAEDLSDFNERLKQNSILFNHIVESILVKGVHYGKFGNMKKPTLLKAGAELLIISLGWTAYFDLILGSYVDEEKGIYSWAVKCTLIDQEEQQVGQGMGFSSCNERQYAYEWVDEKELVFRYPDIDVDRFKSRLSRNGDVTYEVPNNDVASTANTALKMAKKSAQTDAVLNATGLSGYYTQDIGDLGAITSIDPNHRRTLSSLCVTHTGFALKHLLEKLGIEFDILEMMSILQAQKAIITLCAQKDIRLMASSVLRRQGGEVPYYIFNLGFGQGLSADEEMLKKAGIMKTFLGIETSLEKEYFPSQQIINCTLSLSQRNDIDFIEISEVEIG